MEKRYMVIGYGVNEKNEGYSKGYLIVEGNSNKTGKAFGMLDTKQSFNVKDIRPLGSIITVKIEEV